MSNNDLNKVGKSGFMAAFAVATTWFGTHVGGGFASGNQVVSYFAQYGPTTAFLFPLLAMGGLAVVITIIMRFAKVHGYTNYKDTFSNLYPNPKMEILFEIFYIIIVLAAVAAAVTGAGNVLCNFLGIPYQGANVIIFNLIIVAILIILTNFGIKLVVAASAVLSTLIIVISILMVVFGLTVDYDSIAATVMQANGITELTAYTNNFGQSLIRGVFVYLGFQCVSIPAMIASSGDLNLKGATKAGIIGGVLNGVILGLSGLMLAKWYPLLSAISGVGAFEGVNTLSIPNQTVLTLMGIGWLLAAFSILCFCAFISTCVTLVYTLSQRFQVFLLPNTIKSEKTRAFITGILIIAICFAISLLGLTRIVVYAYGYDGYFALLVIVIPAFIWGIPKTRAKLAELKAQGKEV